MWDFEFESVLRSISLKDFESIVDQVDLTANRTTYNQTHQSVPGCVSNLALIRRIMEAKNATLSYMEVSAHCNKWLLCAYEGRDKELIKRILAHPRFSYPGQPSSIKLSPRVELTPLFQILKRWKLEQVEEWELLEFLFSHLPVKDQAYFITDFFTVLRTLELYEFVDKGLVMFSRNVMHSASHTTESLS